MKRISLAALLAIPFLALLPAGCKTPEAPLFQAIENFRLANPGLAASDVSADVRYFNPNNFKLQFRHADLSVYINDHFVGTTVLDTLIEIPKKDSFLIPVAMKVNLQDVLSNALEVLLTKEVTIKLDGFARLRKTGIYIKVPIHYEGKQKIDLSAR